MRDLPTQRQYEILELAALGLTAREIGQRMFLAEKTVKTHLQAARIHLGAANTTQAVAIAIRIGKI